MPKTASLIKSLRGANYSSLNEHRSNVIAAQKLEKKSLYPRASSIPKQERRTDRYVYGSCGLYPTLSRPRFRSCDLPCYSRIPSSYDLTYTEYPVGHYKQLKKKKRPILLSGNVVPPARTLLYSHRRVPNYSEADDYVEHITVTDDRRSDAHAKNSNSQSEAPSNISLEVPSSRFRKKEGDESHSSKEDGAEAMVDVDNEEEDEDDEEGAFYGESLREHPREQRWLREDYSYEEPLRLPKFSRRFGEPIDMSAIWESVRLLRYYEHEELAMAVMNIAAKVNENSAEIANLKDEMRKMHATVLPNNSVSNYANEIHYNPARIRGTKFSIPSLEGLPARSDLGVYVTELLEDGEFTHPKSYLSRVMKVTRYIIERIVPPDMRPRFTVRCQGGDPAHIDFPEPIIQAIRDIHLLCCDVNANAGEFEHVALSIQNASYKTIKNTLMDLRRVAGAKVSGKARRRNLAEYGVEPSKGS